MNRRKNRWQSKPKKDKSGNQYGYLTVIKFSHYAPKSTGGRKLIWECRCKCGEVIKVENSNLISGHVKSCGCFQREKLKELHKTLIKDDIAFKYVLREYVSGAKDRGIEFNLTENEFRELTQKNCYYCGIEPQQIKNKNGSHIFKISKYIYNGVDRVDNSRGYVINNCVSCCKNCNIAKGTRTVEEYLSWAERVYKFNFER